MYWFEFEEIIDTCIMCGGTQIEKITRINDEKIDGIEDTGIRVCHECGEVWIVSNE